MLYIILPVHNRVEQTLIFVDCLNKQTCRDFHVLLIDDGSTDNTVDAVKHVLNASMTTISGKGNLWWAGALQKGYDWVRQNSAAGTSDSILIINNDTAFESDFLESGLSLLAKNSDAMITATAYSLNSKQLFDTGVKINWKKFEFSNTANPAEINCLSTRGIIMSYDTFMKAGGFYPNILPHYFSDYEYTHRAFRKGIKLVTDRSFRLLIDETTTGYDDVKEVSFGQYLKTSLSKRYKSNPYYQAVFIFLSCPLRYIPRNILLISVAFIVNTKNFLRSRKN